MDIFSTATMLRAMSTDFPPQTFIRSMFFPETETFVTEEVQLDIRKGKRRLAPFVRPTEASKLMERIGYTTRTYKPPYVKPKMVTTAGEFLKRPFGSNPYSQNPSPVTLASRRLGEDIAEMWDSILRRIEVMCAEVVRTGKVEIKGDTIEETIDYLMDGNHIITLAGSDLWSDPASDPLGDIKSWKTMIFQKTGLRADKCILGGDVQKAFEAHEGVRAVLDNRRINNIVEIDRMSEGLPPGVEWIGKAEGVNFYTYDEWYLDPDTGLEVPLIPANRLIMGCTGARASVLYGAIQDDDSLVAVEYFPKSWKEPDPPRRYVMLQSAPMPGFHQPDSVVSVQAVA